MRLVQPQRAGVHVAAAGMCAEPKRRHTLVIGVRTHKQAAFAFSGERIEDPHHKTYACRHAELLLSNGAIALDLHWRDALSQCKVWPPRLGGERGCRVAGRNRKLELGGGRGRGWGRGWGRRSRMAQVNAAGEMLKP